VRFTHPQEPLAWLGRGTSIADLYLQVRVGGDVALLQGIAKAVLEEEERRPGRVLDWAVRVRAHDGIRGLSRRDRAAQLGRARGAQRHPGPRDARGGRRVRARAARDRVLGDGITQHAHGVANVQEIMNLLLPCAGTSACRARGRARCAGTRTCRAIRTVGITEKPSRGLPRRARARVRLRAAARAGLRRGGRDPRDARRTRARVRGMGGNFAVASPDSAQTTAALERCELTVQISTTLNRTHLHCGREAYALPCLGRERARRPARGAPIRHGRGLDERVHRSEGRSTRRRRICAARSRSRPASRAPCSAQGLPVPVGALFASDYDDPRR
jgi:hypothetical protein